MISVSVCIRARYRESITIKQMYHPQQLKPPMCDLLLSLVIPTINIFSPEFSLP